MPALRIDGSKRWNKVTLVNGEEHDGPVWLTLSYGDLQAAQYVFVTNGKDAWPLTSVVGLYDEQTAAAS